MSEIVLSQYQKAIINFFDTEPTKNMYVQALAGSAKSFTACKMLEKVDRNSLYVAFNKSIQTEFAERIKNPKVKVYTMHSIGLQIMKYNLQQKQSGGFGKKIGSNEGKLDNFKIFNIVEEICNKENSKKYNYDLKNYLKENYSKLYNLVRLKFVNLHNEYTDFEIKKIIDEYGLFFDEDFYVPDSEIIATVKEIDKLSLKKFEDEKVYDFSDMLYITLTKLRERDWVVPGWLLFTNIVFDEAQDASTVQLFLIKYCIRKGGRIVFILDKNQSIYSFAGANCNSFLLIKKLFAPVQEFDLPINYRCPYSHLNYVNEKYHIGIKARDNAPQGKIKHISKEQAVKLLQPGDFLLGRKNKWLMPMILELVKAGKPVYIKDADFVTKLKKVVEKSKTDSIIDLKYKIVDKENKLLTKIEEKNNSEEKKHTNVSVEDSNLELYYIIKLLIDSFQENYSTFSIKEFLKYIDKVMTTTPSSDSIFVSSIHCAKGLEANNVFILSEAVPTISRGMSLDQKIQEQNLSYIALTRSKNNLYLVKAEGKEYE